MREFRCSCRDVKTGYEMILEDCSYNNACQWLDDKLKEKGSYYDIIRCEYNTDTNLTEIWTGHLEEDTMNIFYGRKFYYDEERGYLLGE